MTPTDATRLDQPHSMKRSGEAERLAATGRTVAMVKDERCEIAENKKEKMAQFETGLGDPLAMSAGATDIEPMKSLAGLPLGRAVGPRSFVTRFLNSSGRLRW
jgi:hypothetical protein